MDGQTIIFGEAIREIQKLDNYSIDYIWIDPPYEILDKIFNKGGSVDWDTWDFKPFITEFLRVLKPNKHITIMNDFKVLSNIYQYVLVNNIKMYYRFESIWLKTGTPSPFGGQKKPSYAHEVVHTYANTKETKYLEYNKVYKKGEPYRRKYRSGSIGQKTEYNLNRRSGSTKERVLKNLGTRIVQSVIHAHGKNRMKIAERTSHPTQKPEKLIAWFIQALTNPGDTVLDCFAGSGSTGVVCKKFNRNFILIEREKKYIDIINKRIDVRVDHKLLDNLL